MWYPSGVPEVDYGGEVESASAGQYKVVSLVDGSSATVAAASLRVLDKDLLGRFADLAVLPTLTVATVLLNLGLRSRDDNIYVCPRLKRP